MEGCLANTVKYSLFATNFLVFLLGCIVLGFGSYVLITGKDFADLVDIGGDESLKIYTSASILLIVIACIIVLITFFGCCGAWKENRCMLGTYFTTILVLFICVLVGAVIAVTQDLDFVRESLKKTQPKYGNDGTENELVTQAWNDVQENYECCGVDWYGDWRQFHDEARFTDDQGNHVDEYTVPKTCCLGVTEDQKTPCMERDGSNNSTAGYTEGCWSKFETTLDENKNQILYSGIVIIVIMFLNMLFAFALCTMAGR